MDFPWPNNAKAAISITLDNLGEAQDVNRGSWPHGKPYGQHPSATKTLPRILDEFDEFELKTTYFAESWSLDKYPEAIEALRSRGHEVAWHGYQHEVWAGQSEGEERENFRKSFAAAERAGVRYRGFRPPGGKIKVAPTFELLGEYGLDYVSALACSPPVPMSSGRIVDVPFKWEGVDAFYYMEKFADIREGLGARREVFSEDECREGMMAQIDEAVRSGKSLSVIFHPFLTTSEERLGVIRGVVKRVCEDDEIWCAPCWEIAKWVGENWRYDKSEQRPREQRDR